MKQITLQQLRNAVVGGVFPSEIVMVKNVPFEFTFTDKDIARCNSLEEQVKFLAGIIKCRNISGTDFLRELPSAYFYPLQSAYTNFQLSTGYSLLEAVKDFVKSPESHGLWATYKHSNPVHVLNIVGDKLNMVQKKWVVLNVEDDTRDKMKLITDIFEIAKPWLDKELYTKIREHEEAMRENAFFDDDKFDARLRAKAKKIAAEQKGAIKNDGDIVVIEDGEN